MTDDLTDYTDASGARIPASHFENEPGPPRPLSSFLSAKDLIAFFMQNIVIRTAAEKIRAARRRH
jgi:hypothetical protein